MQIRRFSAEQKSKIPGGHPEVYAVPIQVDSTQIPDDRLEEYANRVNGLPLMLNRSLLVIAMYLETHASIDEHSATMPILFIVTGGNGFVRIGGFQGETSAIRAGDAVLWPANVDHMVWTEDETLSAIVIEGPAEREE